jgi:hypothetical protein
MILSMVVIIIYMFTFGLTFGSSVWPYISFLVPTQNIHQALVVNWICAGIAITCF